MNSYVIGSRGTPTVPRISTNDFFHVKIYLCGLIKHMCVLPSENEGVSPGLSPHCHTFSAGYPLFLDLSFLNSEMGIVGFFFFTGFIERLD